MDRGWCIRNKGLKNDSFSAHGLRILPVGRGPCHLPEPAVLPDIGYLQQPPGMICRRLIGQLTVPFDSANPYQQSEPSSTLSLLVRYGS